MALSLYIPPRRPVDRSKLGLALAGGGFRASLFHIGVLWRMAELDLLRYVETLSTVSGGSIVGALYTMLLKEKMDASASLTRDQYVAIVKDLHSIFARAMRKDLRTRLIMNPLGILRMLLTQHSLGKRMSRIYERYIYRETAKRLLKYREPGNQPVNPSRWQQFCRSWQQFCRPGRIPLRRMLFYPGGKKITEGIDAYNADAIAYGGSVVTDLILNATSLNSGAPFRFSSTEIGDPRLGYFRYDEIDKLQARKRLLGQSSILPFKVAPDSGGQVIEPPGPRDVALAGALRTGSWEAAKQAWPLVYSRPGFPGRLPTASFGLLRQAKLSAWYIREGAKWLPPVTGGLSREGHLQRFWEVMQEIDEALYTDFKDSADDVQDELLDFVIELYYLRSAQAMSRRIKRDWDKLSLAEAVAASANFPPVFPPMIFLGLYDDLHVTRLGLTDGGVYDNVGISTLLDEGCTHIIASDTGGMFDTQQRVSDGWGGMLARIADVLMDDVASQQRTALRERWRVSDALTKATGGGPLIGQLKEFYKLTQLAFFRIDSPQPDSKQTPLLDLSREAVARLRTDLDAFGDVEIAALVNSGYERAEEFIKNYFTDPNYTKSTGWRSNPVLPMPTGSDKSRTKDVLTVGAHRFFRALYLWSIPSWVFTLAVLFALIGLTLGVTVSVDALIRGGADRIVARLETPVPHAPWLLAPLNWITQLILPLNRLASWLVSGTFSLGLLITVLIAAGLTVFVVWPRLIAWLRDRCPRTARAFITTFKHLRAIWLNVLWLVGLAPLWIALAGFVAGWVSYLCYTRPFLCKTYLAGVRPDRPQS
jgi:predicted acylesterase/phospholipase RssA